MPSISIPQPSFSSRVQQFWDWFPTVADEFLESAKAGTLQDLIPKYQQTMHDHLGGLSWVFGPGENDGNLSFTVTGEGRKPRQLLSHYWLSHEVPIDGWEFYSSRQASPMEDLTGIQIQVGDATIDADSMQVELRVDDEEERVHLKAWHPALEQLDESSRYQIMFLLLDEALGEFGTQMKLGDLSFSQPKSPISLLELPKRLDDIWQLHGWPDASPLEEFTSYSTQTQTNQFYRADTIGGFTCLPNVISEFLGSHGRLEDDPLDGTGAAMLYVSLDNFIFSSPDAMLEEREKIEMALVEGLQGHGMLTGAATGTDHSYIDLIVFDGDQSIANIEHTLDDLRLTDRSELRQMR